MWGYALHKDISNNYRNEIWVQKQTHTGKIKMKKNTFIITPISLLKTFREMPVIELLWTSFSIKRFKEHWFVKNLEKEADFLAHTSEVFIIFWNNIILCQMKTCLSSMYGTSQEKKMPSQDSSSSHEAFNLETSGLVWPCSLWKEWKSMPHSHVLFGAPLSRLSKGSRGCVRTYHIHHCGFCSPQKLSNNRVCSHVTKNDLVFHLWCVSQVRHCNSRMCKLSLERKMEAQTL